LATSDVAKDGGHAREDLVDAAAEVGIDARYMALALREQADGTAVATTSTPVSDDVASRWLGTRRRTLCASRMFDAEGTVILEACCRVFELPRFGLEMVGINHGHPLEPRQIFLGPEEGRG
ncbi:MAG: hypothetical protein JKY37_18445, partial [Nannocystaceae bacterium]|nr:hypothetical protein [Nannocystaceae bacterium]